MWKLQLSTNADHGFIHPCPAAQIYNYDVLWYAFVRIRIIVIGTAKRTNRVNNTLIYSSNKIHYSHAYHVDMPISRKI